MTMRKRERKSAEIRMEEAVKKIVRASLEISHQLTPVALERLGNIRENINEINKQEEN